MKLFKILLAVLLVVVAVLYGFSAVRTAMSGEKIGPIITCNSELLEVSVSDGPEALLAGVSASDPQDGDLTERVRVLGISKFTAPGEAKITYVVFDSHNNMKTATRQLRYTDYRSPRFAITEPLIYPQNANIALLDRMLVTDDLDGDITNSVRVSLMKVTSDPEVYTVDVQVTNSLGDTAQLTLPVICRQNTLNRADVKLSSYLLYLDAGSSFDPRSYLTAVATPDGYGFMKDVEITSLVDTDVPGTYMVFYMYRDENCSGSSILTVVVQ